ncbi:hybrid sensor histidine kinase/response regulator [Oceanospirillum sanctuarii]|uniref:hybrid sensor histidine kinase/response regulator n=1 Tax=Oceanospirillum sanctuarii TaxID=1434821 RepID=UPI000A384FC3|nr:PAS domain-containing hybrid sensor histidine kinase/response regulator [Oceanospirillum sanctuarii]
MSEPTLTSEEYQELLALRQQVKVLESSKQSLSDENYRLQQMNLALIDRVEAAPDVGGRAYAAFENSALLAEQVRERTAALNAALADLRDSNQALKQAHIDIETLHNRLMDAIEGMTDAFVLFDGQRRMVLCNSRYRQIWQRYGFPIEAGTTLSEINRHGAEILLDDATTQEELQLYQQAYGQVIRLRDGRWMQVNQRETATGDLSILYTDITELKAIETERREAALAEKSRILQSTLENLSQGVVLVSDQGIPEVWNTRLTELTGIKEQELGHCRNFTELLNSRLRDPAVKGKVNTPATGQNWPLPLGDTAHYEIGLKDGSVLEIRQQPRAEGGRVITFTDITERSLFARALQQSEQKMRLITDALPAMICYVNARQEYEFTNKAYQEWHGLNRDELQGRHLSQVYSERQLHRLEHYVDKVIKGDSVSFEVDEANQDGEIRYLHKTYVPHLAASGETLGFFVLTQDITERRRTAQALRDANVLLEQRVEERTSELLDAKKQAEEANLSKTKFLAAISHDLLQPMNAARLFNSALAEYPLDGAARKLVTSTASSLSDVEGLIGALVDISKLDAGVVEAQMNNFTLDALLQSLCHEYEEQTALKQQRFRSRVGGCLVYSDSQLLGRILRNFLTNASRYTEAGGQILLATRKKGSCISIEVWDSGEGIEPEKMSEIFREFSRLKRSTSASDKGLGLGLAIVDKIARVLDHKIRVRSVPGKGSVFSVEVPLADPNQLELTERVQPAPQINPLESRPVLVLDNDPAICLGMEQLLDGWGMDVMTALGRDDALQLIEDGFRPDLLLVDYHLDNDEIGVDVAQELNALMTDPVPVIVITANYSKALNSEIQAINYQLLNKPVKPMKLRLLMGQLMS